MNFTARRLLLALSLATLAATPAYAEDVTVTAQGVKFDAEIVYIDVGDSVSWTGMTGHNVETIPAMSPEGYEQQITELGEDVTLTFDTPGIIVYKCTPHWGARMGGTIVVGEPEDARGTIDAYMAAIEEDRAGLLPAKGLLKHAMADLESKGF